MNFYRYSTSQGLSQGRINCIVQDEDGYMWFGSNNALNKFDGYNFSVYQYNESDSSTIGGRRIIVFLKDSKKRLWIGCGNNGCLSRYNTDLDNFSSFLTLPYDTIKDYHYSINAIVEDSTNNIWVGTSFGLCRINSNDTQDFTWYRHKQGNPEGLSSNLIFSLYFDNKVGLWIGYKNGDIDLFRINKGDCLHFKNENNGNLNYEVNSIQKVSTNTYLAGLWKKGLKCLKFNNQNKMSNEFSSMDVRVMPITGALSSELITSMYIDRHEKLWVCTDNGLNRYNGNLKDLSNNPLPKFEHFYNDPVNTYSLNHNYVICVYQDKSDVLWVGTSTGLHKSLHFPFLHFKKQGSITGLCSNKIHAILEDGQNKFWIATSKGLNSFKKEEQSFTRAITDTSFISICKDSKGFLWLGTWNNGLIKYDPSSHKSKKYISIENSHRDIEFANINSLYADKENNIWMSIWSQGAAIYHINDDVIQFIPGSERNRYINVFYEDRKGNIYAGTLYGLVVLVGQDKDYIESSGILKKHSFLKSINVNCICEDDSQNIWIGTNNGLVGWNFEENTSAYFSKDDGLPSNEILAIVPNDEELWLSTSNGISKISGYIKKGPIHEDKEKVAIKNFNQSNGLQGLEFVQNSFCKATTGEIFFGGTNGFNMFDPTEISSNKTLPVPRLTGFNLFNKQVSVGEKIEDEVLLPCQVSKLKKLELKHNQNFFTFFFSAMHYSSPENNSYAYKMEGFDKEWNYIGHENKVSFIGLEPGDYIFKLKAANSDNVWNPDPVQFKVVIHPPWWQTNWFKFILLVLLTIMIYLAIRLRFLRLQKQKHKLENLVLQRTAELREMNQLLKERKEELEHQTHQLENKNQEIGKMAEKLHEADQLKLRFFHNISHEFRTPLTLIAGPVEKCMQLKEWNKEKIQHYHQLIYKNVKRLLRLVNQIIDFGKIEQHHKKLNISNNNIIGFTKEIASVFSAQAEAKDIHLSLNINHSTFKNKYLPLNMEHVSNDEDKLINDKCNMNNDKCEMINDFWFDPDVMEKILYNLISNAIKFTPEGGEITIAIGVAVETRHALSLPNNQLAIKISDTGIGIKPENLDKIFDRFYRVETRFIASLPEGTGIGLAYTKELVLLHKGEINVESRYGSGTTMTLLFPIIGRPKEISDHSTGMDKSPPDFKYSQSMIENQEDYKVPSMNIMQAPGKTEEKADLLLVEDNDELREFITNELQGNYFVQSAGDGDKGYELATKHLPDLIISDIMMPGLNGVELCHKLKTNELTSHIPIILLTAKAGEDSILSGIRSGADDYIVKPFSLRVLTAKLNNIHTIRKQLKAKYTKMAELPSDEIIPSTIDDKILKNAIEIVEQNMENPDFSNNDFIAQLGFGRTMAYKKIKALTNQSISEFINNIKIKKATQLLLSEQFTVSEIAIMVGFKYRENFYKQFTSKYGKSPSQYVADKKKE